jgi:hypothetical protein
MRRPPTLSALLTAVAVVVSPALGTGCATRQNVEVEEPVAKNLKATYHAVDVAAATDRDIDGDVVKQVKDALVGELGRRGFGGPNARLRVKANVSYFFAGNQLNEAEIAIEIILEDLIAHRFVGRFTAHGHSGLVSDKALVAIQAAVSATADTLADNW